MNCKHASVYPAGLQETMGGKDIPLYTCHECGSTITLKSNSVSEIIPKQADLTRQALDDCRYWHRIAEVNEKNSKGWRKLYEKTRGEKQELEGRVNYLEGQLKVRKEMYYRAKFGENWREVLEKCERAHKEDIECYSNDI